MIMNLVAILLNLLIQWFWILLGLVFVLLNRKVLFRALFLEPIRGGNGITQMDELAKYILLMLAIVVTFNNLDSETTLYAVLGAAVTIAGLQIGGDVWKKNNQNKKE